MKILFRKSNNQPLQIMDIENEVAKVQELIGGYFAVININSEILCLCDEDGIQKGLGNNFYDIRYGWIVGNVIFISSRGKLTEKKMQYVSKYLGVPIEK